MIGSIVQPAVLPESPPDAATSAPPSAPRPGLASLQGTDPLSQVLALMRPQPYVAGGFALADDIAVHFPKHNGIKCYAVLSGECWLAVEGVEDPILLKAGDCFLLPHGLPFRLATDPALRSIPYLEALACHGIRNERPDVGADTRYIAGGHFSLTGGHAEMVLQSLPSIVPIRRESDRAVMRWSLQRMREELANPQQGSALIAQQLAYMMLIQALRLHLADAEGERRGWLFALSDKHMCIALTALHNEPGYPWTLLLLAERVGMSRSAFALRFRECVGSSPMEYLARWRMLLAADRLKHSSEGLCAIAHALGYESESAFGKAFRRIMGSSPRQYMRSAANSTAV